MIRACLITAVLTCAIAAADPAYFTGTLGQRTKIAMRIDNIEASKWTGVYYYLSVGDEIPLNGTRIGGRLELSEFAEQDKKPTGTFRLDGTAESAFRGIWVNPSNTRRFSVELIRNEVMTDDNFQSLKPKVKTITETLDRPDFPSDKTHGPFNDLFANFQRDRRSILRIIFPNEVSDTNTELDCKRLYQLNTFNTKGFNWKRLDPNRVEIFTNFAYAQRECNRTSIVEIKNLRKFLRPRSPLN